MVKIKIEGEKVLFEVQGWDKLWSLRSQLEIPLSHIIRAYIDTEPAMGWFPGIQNSWYRFTQLIQSRDILSERRISFLGCK